MLCSLAIHEHLENLIEMKSVMVFVEHESWESWETFPNCTCFNIWIIEKLSIYLVGKSQKSYIILDSFCTY